MGGQLTLLVGEQVGGDQGVSGGQLTQLTYGGAAHSATIWGVEAGSQGSMGGSVWKQAAKGIRGAMGGGSWPGEYGAPPSSVRLRV